SAYRASSSVPPSPRPERQGRPHTSTRSAARGASFARRRCTSDVENLPRPPQALLEPLPSLLHDAIVARRLVGLEGAADLRVDLGLLGPDLVAAALECLAGQLPTLVAVLLHDGPDP